MNFKMIRSLERETLTTVDQKPGLLEIANVINRSFINSWLQRLSTARVAMYEILPGGSH